MSSAVQLAASRRLRIARAELDAQRIAAAVLQAKGGKGEEGKRGPKGDKPDHEWQGTQLRFEKPDGGWGELVDLRGPKGAKGSRGKPAAGGASPPPPAAGVVGFDPSALLPASNATPQEFIVHQAGEWVRATYAQMQTWLGGGGSGPVHNDNALRTEAGDALLTESGLEIVKE